MTKNINNNLIPPNNRPTIPDINIKNPNQELDEDQLLSIYLNWKSIRLIYPGWEIAPYQNRKSLWYLTRKFYNRIFYNFRKLSNPNDINLLYELIWRINNCLLPLDTGYLNLITEIVQKYNPFPNIIQNSEATITSENQQYNHYNWKEISTQWIELIFTIITDFRHDLNENLFYKWLNILSPLADLNSEISLRIYYEKSLFLLNQLRESELRNVLSEWPENKDFPFYMAQKASIYAELGDVNTAKNIAEEALNEIRNQLHMTGTNYKLMSQEGWIIVLLNIIYNNKRNRGEVYFENKDRLEKLLFYRCNPFMDIDGLDSELKRSQPVYKKSIVRRKTFDPDIITISESLTEGVIDTDQLMPAYNFLFLFEKGCLPMRCGIVTVYNEAIFDAAKWIKTTLPVWSLSSFLRSGNKDNFDKYLSRIFIAVLTETEVDFIYENFYNSLNNCMDTISLSIDKKSFISNKYLFTTISSSSETLSRISIRLSIEKLIKLLKLAIKMYMHPLFRKDERLHKYVNIMFKRILSSFSREMLFKELTDLLLLPIVNEPHFTITNPEYWPEPFDYIEFDDSKSILTEVDLTIVSNRINELIEYVKSENPYLRRNSIARLNNLYLINGLTIEQKPKFLKALWSQIDKKTGLPLNTKLYDFSFLHITNLTKKSAKEKIKNIILNEDFPRVISKNYSHDGKLIRVSGFGHEESFKYIYNIINATKPLFKSQKNFKLNYIEWTETEIIQMTDKLIKWWNEEKVDLSENDESSILYGSGEIRDAFKKVDYLLSRVILPRIKLVNSILITKLENLIEEMNENGFSMLCSETILLKFNRLNTNTKFYGKLLDGLNSTKEDLIKNATDAVFLWIVYYSNKKMLKYPHDILNELLTRLASRRQPGLYHIFITVNKLVEYLPRILSEETLIILESALKYLFYDIKYPTKEMLENKMIENNVLFTYEEIPVYRELSSQLASNLYTYYKKNNIEIPEIINLWKEEALKDPLPEVRLYWER